MAGRNRVPTLQDLCGEHFGLTIYDIQKLIDEPDNRVPYYHQVDPRAIESYLFEPNVPIFCVHFKKLVLTHEAYREQYRYNVWSVAEDTREYQLRNGTYSESDHLREVKLGYDRWWLGYQKTYQRLDDCLLATYIYPRGLPGGEQGVTWHARKSPSTIYATARAILRLCPFLPTTPLPDFQDIQDLDQGDSIYRYIEDKLFKISLNLGTDFQSFVYRALAHGTTEPDNWDLLDEHPIPEHRCKDVYSFLIAAVCRYQVAVSQSYTNFPSIDQLRQKLLDRAGRRPYKGTAWTSCRTAIGSWEGGVSELRVLPSDEEVEANYNAYVASYVWLASQGGT